MKNYFLIIVLIIISLSLVEALISMLLWNWIAPLFWDEAPILNFWQATGVLILLNILFKTGNTK